MHEAQINDIFNQYHPKEAIRDEAKKASTVTFFQQFFFL